MFMFTNFNGRSPSVSSHWPLPFLSLSLSLHTRPQWLAMVAQGVPWSGKFKIVHFPSCRSLGHCIARHDYNERTFFCILYQIRWAYIQEYMIV